MLVGLTVTLPKSSKVPKLGVVSASAKSIASAWLNICELPGVIKTWYNVALPTKATSIFSVVLRLVILKYFALSTSIALEDV